MKEIKEMNYAEYLQKDLILRKQENERNDKNHKMNVEMDIIRAELSLINDFYLISKLSQKMGLDEEQSISNALLMIRKRINHELEISGHPQRIEIISDSGE